MSVQYMLNLQTFFTDQSVVCLCFTISQVLESRIRPTMQNSTHLRHTPRLHILLCNWKMNPLQKTAKVKLQAMGCLENSGMLSHPHRMAVQRLSNAAELLRCLVAKWQRYWEKQILDDEVNFRQTCKRGTIAHFCVFWKEKVLQGCDIIRLNQAFGGTQDSNSIVNVQFSVCCFRNTHYSQDSNP